MFRHERPLAVKPASTPPHLVQKKNTWRNSLPIDMLLSAMSVFVVVQSISEIPEGLMNYPVFNLLPLFFFLKISFSIRLPPTRRSSKLSYPPGFPTKTQYAPILSP